MYNEEEFKSTIEFLDKMWNDLSKKMENVNKDEHEILMRQRIAIRKAQLIIEEIYYEQQ